MSSLFPTDPSQVRGADGRPGGVQFPRTWQFDHGAGDFEPDPAGRIAVCRDVDAYRQWALNTLLTPRYRHPTYGRQVGTEVEEMLRQNLPQSILESELARTITEALMVDPRTARVGDFVFRRQGNALEVSCTITTARGDAVGITVPLGGDAR